MGSMLIGDILFLFFRLVLELCTENPFSPTHRIYDLYSDYVLKNPFYEVEMPIKCELFDQHLLELVRTTHARLGTLAP